MEWQDLESIGNKKARETNVVENTEEPDEDQLGISGASVLATRVFIDGTDNGPADERTNHAENCSQKQRSATDLVDSQGSGDGDRKIENRLTSADLFRVSICYPNAYSKNLPQASGSDQ
jgi:hypothetical protein